MRAGSMIRSAFCVVWMLNLASVLQAADKPKAGEEIEIDIGDGAKLRVCWIPAGKFVMGSPDKEREYVNSGYTYVMGAFDDYEKEHEVEVSGFWMGKFDVTQGQYAAIAKTNPSYFSAQSGGKNHVQGMDTSEFPVEQVSWKDAQKWISELNRRIADGKAKVPAQLKGWKASLPSEAQWEYAARGGRGNGHPFYWGDQLNGTQANCIGTKHPYGTETTGPSLDRTSQVGSYEKLVPHAWGLCDMAGNVSQWCEDYWGPYDRVPKTKNPVQRTLYVTDGRALRGGAFGYYAGHCRSADRMNMNENKS